MKDYNQKKRQQQILLYQIDFILDNKEIPDKLLDRIGIKDQIQ